MLNKIFIFLKKISSAQHFFTLICLKIRNRETNWRCHQGIQAIKFSYMLQVLKENAKLQNALADSINDAFYFIFLHSLPVLCACVKSSWLYSEVKTNEYVS